MKAFNSILLLCLLNSGCETSFHRTAHDSPLSWQDSGFHPAMPSGPFGSYEAAFRYIATCEGLSLDSHTLFALAADSTVERLHSPLGGALVVVRAEYYGQSRFGIRGAQGNGRY